VANDLRSIGFSPILKTEAGGAAPEPGRETCLIVNTTGELRAWLDSFVPEPLPKPIESPAAMLVPHLDYERGGQIYANVFAAGREALLRADLVLIFGTDHHGPSITPTLTRQDYATPLGAAHTALDVVDKLQAASPETDLLAHELYHRGEHSIELALIWAQHILDGRQVEFLPVLAGSVHEFLEGLTDNLEDPINNNLARTLREILNGKNVAAIASGDLAHIGPAFGGKPVSEPESLRLHEADMHRIDRLLQADALGFLELIRSDQNRDGICGSAPIHRLLTWGDYKRGHLVGYTQCHADGQGTSVVSACGIVYEK
jgi:AmmeMemoRadiSam system protein B